MPKMHGTRDLVQNSNESKKFLTHTESDSRGIPTIMAPMLLHITLGLADITLGTVHTPMESLYRYVLNTWLILAQSRRKTGYLAALPECRCTLW